MSTDIDFKIDKDTVVHAKTKEEAIKLCEFLDRLGATWGSGNRYTKECSKWDDICYDLHARAIGTVKYHILIGYKIITVDEFLKLHEPEFIIDDNTVIHIETKEEARNLYHWVSLLDYNYDKYPLYEMYTNWDLRDEYTCYRISNNSVGSLQAAKDSDYKIIPAKDFIKYVATKKYKEYE